MIQYIYNGQKYYVSRYGVVFKNGQMLSQYDNGIGFRTVILCGKPHYVHKLVGELYVPNPENRPYIVHKNLQIQDNRPSNLEWRSNITYNIYSDNSKHSITRIIPHYKTAIIQIDATSGVELKRYSSQKDAAIELNVSPRSIWSALKKHHLCKGFKWKYA